MAFRISVSQNKLLTLGIRITSYNVCYTKLLRIEYARNVLHLQGVNSTEMEYNCANPVIDLMEEQKTISQMGGTMRLGAYDCSLKTGSNVEAIYGSTSISERHRHRYEFNNKYLSLFEEGGMKPVGTNPDRNNFV